MDLAEYNCIIKNYTLAETYVLRAMSLYKEHGSIRDICTCEMRMGIIRYETGDYLLAKAAFKRALVLNNKCYDSEHPYSKELRAWLDKSEDMIKNQGI